MNSASLSSLVGRYDNHIPSRFLAPIDCLKIPAQEVKQYVYSSSFMCRFTIWKSEGWYLFVVKWKGADANCQPQENKLLHIDWNQAARCSKSCKKKDFLLKIEHMFSKHGDISIKFVSHNLRIIHIYDQKTIVFRRFYMLYALKELGHLSMVSIHFARSEPP